MVEVAIVEDDAVCLERIAVFCQKFMQENPAVQLKLSTFENGKEFIDCPQSFDIVFMDIEMPQMDGMTAAELLRKKDPDVTLIFVTRMIQFAVNGYSVNAFDFMVKPISYRSFAVKFKKALEERARHREKKIKVCTDDNDSAWLSTSAIYYVEITGHVLTYHTEIGEYTTRGSLADAEAELRDYGFCSCSRYYLINLKHVNGVSDGFVIIGPHRLEISRRKKKELMDILLDYYGGSGSA